MSKKVKKAPKLSKGLEAQAGKLAKLMALRCARNRFIEKRHSGTSPGSKTGDYSDVKVVTPYGEIPWNELSRISDDEMKILNKEIGNKIFPFLLSLQKEGLPEGPRPLYPPTGWDDAEIDQDIKAAWNDSRKQENKETNGRIGKPLAR